MLDDADLAAHNLRRIRAPGGCVWIVPIDSAESCPEPSPSKEGPGSGAPSCAHARRKGTQTDR